MQLERLGAVDAAFLAIEDDRDPMHIALAGIFDNGPLATRSRKLDREKIRLYAKQVLASLPQFRQRIIRVPYFRRPYYSDDASFDLDYHLRFVELEPPGDDRQLKALLGRIYTESLSRDRPLWQLWCVDGLDGDRFATVTKVHHCLVDGVAGIAVLGAMLRTTPDASIQAGEPWVAAPLPSPQELLRTHLRSLASEPRAIWDAFARAAPSLSSVSSVVPKVVRLIRASLSVAAQCLPSASKTVLNPRHIGGERSFDWVHFPFEKIHDIKQTAGTTINDVVLAIVTGAVRRYLGAHGTNVGRLRFRVMVPVSLHDAGPPHLKNEVSVMVARLPLDAEDAKRRLERVSAVMRHAKRSGQSSALSVGEQIADHTLQSLVGILARATVALRPINMIVTNVPGPNFPLYLLGARLIEAIPMVPLYVNQAIGIAVLSYDGRVYFGLNADASHIQDVSRFASCLLASFREIETAYAREINAAAQ